MANPEEAAEAGGAEDVAPPSAAEEAPQSGASRRRVGRLRGKIPLWQQLLFGGLCLALCLGVWWWLTAGAISEERIVSRLKLPSPRETVSEFRSLWFERQLSTETVVTLRRVAVGFGLATLVGVPLGILCGCFPRVGAFFAPLTIFGRNVPMAALIPLTFFLFGIAETQKVMFIFLASVAFIVFDTTQAIRDVASRYVDTAFTLGASRWQVILKVLTPLALPSVFNSLRLLFGLAFGYIMLAEVVKFGGEAGGLGHVIITSQRKGPYEHIYLILLIIPVVALIIDRGLYWIQRSLFPYRYGGNGALAWILNELLHGWQALQRLFWKPHYDPALVEVGAAAPPSDKPAPPSGEEAR